MGLLARLFGKKPSADSPSPSPSPSAPVAASPVPGLAAALDAPNGAVRVDASRALLDLWRSGDFQAAAALTPRVHELLADKEPQVRITGLGAVRLMRKPENLERHASAAMALLADPVSQVRAAAVWAVVRLPGDVPRAQLCSLLASAEDTLCFSAACALAELKDPSCLPTLLSALPEDHRRHESLSALMTLGDPAALPALRDEFNKEGIGQLDRTAVAAALASLGDQEGKAHLVERVEDTGDDRPIAVEWAGRLDLQEAIPLLKEIAAAEGDMARGAALRALGRLHAPGASELLQELAGDAEAEDDLRLDAAEGLAELNTPEARALLMKLAEGEQGRELTTTARELLVELAAAEAQAKAQAEAEAKAGAKAKAEADAKASPNASSGGLVP